MSIPKFDLIYAADGYSGRLVEHTYLQLPSFHVGSAGGPTEVHEAAV